MQDQEPLEESIKRLFVTTLSQRAILDALIAAHPDPAYLKKLVAGMAEPAMVTLLGMPWADRYPAQLREEIASALRLIEQFHPSADPAS